MEFVSRSSGLTKQATDYHKSHRAGLPYLPSDPRTIYHDLNQHPALSPVPNPSLKSSVSEQLRNEAEYRQLLVQGMLTVLLPTEELENPCARTLAADVLGEIILGNTIGGRASEGWFIWQCIINIVQMVKARLKPKLAGEEATDNTKSQLEQFGLLAERDGSPKPIQRHAHNSILAGIFWRILQLGYVSILVVGFVLQSLIAAFVRAPRSSPLLGISPRDISSPIATNVDAPSPRRPILAFNVFSLVSILLDLPLRMPWLLGAISLIRHELIYGWLKVGISGGLLDQ